LSYHHVCEAIAAKLVHFYFGLKVKLTLLILSTNIGVTNKYGTSCRQFCSTQEKPVNSSREKEWKKWWKIGAKRRSPSGIAPRAPRQK
jgi:hypothetical protein